jgi:hypothetical protein
MSTEAAPGTFAGPGAVAFRHAGTTERDAIHPYRAAPITVLSP